MPSPGAGFEDERPVWEARLAQPVETALCSTHEHFALRAGLAAKYPAAVTPFAALRNNTAAALQDLGTLLEPGETAYVHGPRPQDVKGFRLRDPLPCLQMLFPDARPLPVAPAAVSGQEVVPLSWDDAGAMVALTDVAFPGYFRRRTCEMGTYYGVHHEGRLIAMAGERLCLNPLREVSGVCTHPDFRGQGLATRLMLRVMQDHRRDGNVSWLHVVTTNRGAIALYLRMGFETVREVMLHGVSLTPPASSPL